MKSLEELKEEKRIGIRTVGADGGNGMFFAPVWIGTVVWSFSGGWDHVSVAPCKRNITPTWDDMCLLKNTFFHEDEAVIQIHPPKSEYVNNLGNCLHLWRKQDGMELPPSWMTGAKDGETMDEVYRKALKEMGVGK